MVSKFIATALLVLGLTTPATALDRKVYFETRLSGSLPCDGTWRVVDWWPEARIRILRVEVRMGSNAGNPFPPVDIHTVIYTSQPNDGGYLLFSWAQDRYIPQVIDRPEIRDWPLETAPFNPEGTNIQIGHRCQNIDVNLPSASTTEIRFEYVYE